MKRILTAVFTVIVFVISCKKDTVSEHYTFFRPVYSTKEAVKAGIKSTGPQVVLNPGKLVMNGNFVFLNDIDRGIHIIDNSDPCRPKTVSFIPIPGCVDMAIKGSYLFADCYTGMVTMDISDPLNIIVTQFLDGVFPERNYSNFVADTARIILQWVRVDTVIKRSFNNALDNPSYAGGILLFASAQSLNGSSSSAAGIGISGSMTRFAQMNNRLYAVSNSNLKVFNTSNAAAPSYTKLLNMPNGNIETIFPSGNQLFIGTQTGMLVYDAQNPDQPAQIGQFSHTRTCDPVITDGNYAYETLRSNGSTCGGFTNELDVIDISNLTAPSLVKAYTLKSPAGLSKDGNLLFICDGTDGLKIFDATNPLTITMIKQLPGFNAYDVIVQNGIAVVVANEGLYTVAYSDKNNIQLLGKIPVAQTK
jgi:hypothetical protein